MDTALLNANETLQQFTRLIPPAGLTRPLPQIRLLLTLNQPPQMPQTPSAIASQWHVSRAAVTKALAPLVADGLINKIPNQYDQRSFDMDLTPAGQALAESLAAQFLQPLTTLREHLGKAAFAMLFDLLNQANLALAANQTPAP